MIFIWDSVPSKILEKHIFPNDVESIFVEFNFRKCKWQMATLRNIPSTISER